MKEERGGMIGGKEVEPFITTTETKQSVGDWLGFGNNRNSVRELANCVVLGV